MASDLTWLFLVTVVHPFVLASSLFLCGCNAFDESRPLAAARAAGLHSPRIESAEWFFLSDRCRGNELAAYEVVGELSVNLEIGVTICCRLSGPCILRAR